MEISYTIRWLDIAFNNLRDETAYIYRNNPKAAKEFTSQVRQQVNLLSQHPHLGRPGRLIHTRELIIHGYPYIIPYQIKKNP